MASAFGWTNRKVAPRSSVDSGAMIGPAGMRSNSPKSASKPINEESLFSSWKEFTFQTFGMGPPKIGRQASRIIHPLSPFAQFLTILTTGSLLYTALVVPVTVGFFWNESECYRMATLEIDLAVDSFFILQIIVTFFIGVYKKGVYYDDLLFVADNYVRGPLLFDVVTSVPVSYIDAWVLASPQCDSEDPAAENAFNMASLRLLRILKPLRIFKMIRILKLIRVLHVFDAIEKILRPPPLLFRVFRVLAGIAFLVHACACTYWLVKSISSEQAEIDQFLMGRNLEPNASLAQKYILSQYFVNTVFTTVGFGDISAESTAEQIYCIVIMYCGTIVFGVLLSEIESAVSSMRAFPRKKGRTIQKLMDFLKEQDVPTQVRNQVLKWVDFDTTVEHEDKTRQKALESVPPELRKILVGQLHHDELDNVPLFQSITSSHRERLLVDLWDKMESTRIFESLPIALAGERADRLHVVMKGEVRVTLRDGSFVTDLGPGDFFGELALIGDDRWGAEYGMEANYVCLTSVLCRTLTKDVFDEVICSYPEDLEMEVEDMERRHAEKTLAREAAKELRKLSTDDGKESPDETPNIARWTQVVRKAALQARIQTIDSSALMRRAAQKITLQSASAWVRTKDESRMSSPFNRSRLGSVRSFAGSLQNCGAVAEDLQGSGDISSAIAAMSPSKESNAANGGKAPVEALPLNGMNGNHDFLRDGAMASPVNSQHSSTSRMNGHRGSCSDESKGKLQSSINGPATARRSSLQFSARRNSQENNQLEALSQQVQTQSLMLHQQATCLAQLQRDMMLVSHMLRTHLASTGVAVTSPGIHLESPPAPDAPALDAKQPAA